ncbi:MAG TPA: hypothetical protein VG821_08260 [Rhizomicrobium sp.]|nr:hypothetical protein [Rhizomicrobium sp.]
MDHFDCGDLIRIRRNQNGAGVASPERVRHHMHTDGNVSLLFLMEGTEATEFRAVLVPYDLLPEIALDLR